MTDRVRVKDKDTGYDRTISEQEVPHGNYQVLKQDAVDPLTGDDVPADLHLEDATTTGQSAATTKEKGNA